MKLPPIGKFIDQPLLVNKLHSKMPVLLASTAAIFGIHNTLKQPPKKRKTQAVKNFIVLSSIVLASLGGIKMIEKLKIGDMPENKNVLTKAAKKAVDTFVKNNNVKDSKLLRLLEKGKTKILGLGETSHILEGIKGTKGAQEVIDTLFGKAKDINSKEILGEIGKLSLMGLTPVIAGVGGGILADKITKTGNERSTADKIKEGIYQFLANIFMCNIGAAGALFGTELLQKKGLIQKLSPLKKTGVILGGITLTGIIGGNYIANFIGKKILDPLFDKKSPEQKKDGQKFLGHNHHKKCNDRKPEFLDVALHTDDIATAGVLSGFKWIEPMLPLMYMISGYRAGFGYRNNIPNPTSETLIINKNISCSADSYANQFGFK